MKNSFFIAITILLLGSKTQTIAQEQENPTEKYTSHNKGKFFVNWGGNIADFSKSNITFKGDTYNFTLSNVAAEDKPKGFHIDYINPMRMTIPQTNFRIGYFLTDDEAKNGALLATNGYRAYAAAGTIKFEDANGDGKIDLADFSIIAFYWELLARLLSFLPGPIPGCPRYFRH